MRKHYDGSDRSYRGGDLHDETDLRPIIARAKRGEHLAYRELVRRYQRQVAAVAYKIVGDYDDAADVTQMVFLKTSQNLQQYDESRRFYTWLYRITINASIDYLRKHRRHRHESLEVVGPAPGYDRRNPESSFYMERLQKHIKAATENLNKKQKMAFVLRDIEGCQIDTVAGIMEMPEPTVRWYLYRARSRIRRELMRKCPHLLQVMGVI